VQNNYSSDSSITRLQVSFSPVKSPISPQPQPVKQQRQPKRDKAEKCAQVRNFLIEMKPKQLLLNSPVILSKFGDDNDDLIDSFLTTAVKSPTKVNSSDCEQQI
jgi:hypothetical protein